MDDLFELDVVVIRENMRYVPGRGWSKQNLFARDPLPFLNSCCDVGGSRPESAAPMGTDEEWTDASWRVQIDASTDRNGWRYCRSFGGANWRPRASLTTVARWREWARGRRRRVARHTATDAVNGTVSRLTESSSGMFSRASGNLASLAARAMSMSPAERHARVVALSMSLSVSESRLEAEEKARLTLSGDAKQALLAEAAACRAAADASGDAADAAVSPRRDFLLDQASRALAQEEDCLKRLALPGYETSHIIRGEGGLCVGVRDLRVERCAGQLIIHAHPADAELPQVLLEAQGICLSG